MSQPAARITDMHVCPIHGGGPIIPPCAVTVLTGGMPQARVGDFAMCPMPLPAPPIPDPILMGSPTVIVMGSMAARMGDPHTHGGTIITGFPTVLIGVAGTGSATNSFSAGGSSMGLDGNKASWGTMIKVLEGGAQKANPFCEICNQ